MTVTIRLGGGNDWAAAMAAGARLSITALQAGAGAAFFAWAHGDPYEQLSDAYTFMELRRSRPGVGARLFSTLRRAILTVVRDDVAPAIDLLIHDAWLPRTDYVPRAAAAVARRGLPCPSPADWPFATNLFVRTSIATDGALDLQMRGPPGPATIVLSAECPLVVAIVAVGDLEIGSDGAG